MPSIPFTYECFDVVKYASLTLYLSQRGRFRTGLHHQRYAKCHVLVKGGLTHSRTMTPFDASGKQAF